MKRKMIFGIIALLPAAFGPVTAGASSLVAALCTGNGHSRSITIPLKPALPGSNDLCCAKGCHAGGSRKRTACDNCLPD
jgi:hypothetical protein